MTERMLITGLAAAFLAGGVVLGWAYFRLMRFSLQYLGRSTAMVSRFTGLAVLRIALLCAGAVAAFTAGLWPFIAFTAGFLTARTMALSGVEADKAETEETSDGTKADG